MVCLEVNSTDVLRLLDALVSGLGSSYSSGPRGGERGCSALRQPSVECLKEKRLNNI